MIVRSRSSLFASNPRTFLHQHQHETKILVERARCAPRRCRDCLEFFKPRIGYISGRFCRK
ncbi:hypothetical protein RB11236 [Rhodopirellula baltica SH 1]|uniref:Uncharacterized protein n=1 Tax=Rhodopirellula baltica (strain DSM 10527 / NCIMB 13988 / SH1) TaxID=243090 RepID=Q7UEN0_RHOBA|nr:hypothetical protein RB11236 [Rhodopirellula baltica SH 1]